MNNLLDGGVSTSYCKECGRQLNWRYSGYQFKCDCGILYEITNENNLREVNDE